MLHSSGVASLNLTTLYLLFQFTIVVIAPYSHTTRAVQELILQLLTYCPHIRASLLASIVAISGIVGA